VVSVLLVTKLSITVKVKGKTVVWNGCMIGVCYYLNTKNYDRIEGCVYEEECDNDMGNGFTAAFATGCSNRV
jgi:hypothetical protein